MGLNKSDLLAWTDEEVKRINLRQFLNSGVINRLRSGLGGSHTVVTYPPLDALEQINQREILDKITPVESVSLYWHIAFCEFLCPFCHYDTEFAKLGVQEEPPKVIAYLTALKKEIINWKKKISGSKLDSLYIGGGTPTAVSEEGLLSLLSLIDDIPRQSEDCTICLETSPLTTVALDGKQKLQALFNAGVNRFSMGIQTFDSQLLRRTRGYSQKEAVQALEILCGISNNINIDMIQDLPEEQTEHILMDLEQIERFLPAQVTWYILRIRPEASWFSRLKRKSLDLADAFESARRALLIREGMKRLGYFPKAGGRFVRKESSSDRFKDIRAGLKKNLLGMGVSAYSHGWGYMFRNTYSRGTYNGILNYIAQINKEGFAIEKGCGIESTELLASKFVTGIRTGIYIPEDTTENGKQLISIKETLQNLYDLGLVDSDIDGCYRLTQLGSLFEEEICALFYSSAVKEKLMGNLN